MNKIQTIRQLAPKRLTVYEVVLPGFDGSTDDTDDRILWVAAKDRATVASITGHLPCMRVGRDWITEEAIDFVLPRDAAKLRERIDA